MFRQRLIMTLILIPLVLGGIIYAPHQVFVAAMVLLLWGMSYEWQQFVAFKELDKPIFKTLLIFLGSILVAYFSSFFLYVNLVFWGLAVLFILNYPKYKQNWVNTGFISFVGWLLLGIFAAIICEWQQTTEGVELLFCVLFIVWSADIGAYLFGRKWGRHKMLPVVSPGKSWEGLFGGMLLVFVVAYLESLYVAPESVLAWLFLAMVTAVISVFGDLWISVLKRNVNLKDTGHIIPGHGGLLDRLDSLLAAIPVFYFGMKFLG
jgi:phosphatidate cytidylyltransferase